MTHLTKFHKTKKQNIATGLLLDKLHKQDFAGPLQSCLTSPWDRPVVIVLMMPHMSPRALGYLLASFASSVMGFVRRRDFTLLSLITRAVMDAQMNLTLPLITMSVPGCTTSLFLRHATILPQRNHFLHDLITQVFLWSFQYGIVVLGFLDAFTHTHHKHHLDSANTQIHALPWRSTPHFPTSQAQVQVSISSQ